MKNQKFDLYQTITNQVIELIENDQLPPWRKTWSGSDTHPASAATGKRYRGINPFLLQIAQMSGGFSDHRWITFNQVKKAGGKVKKGASSSIVVFWK